MKMELNFVEIKSTMVVKNSYFRKMSSKPVQIRADRSEIFREVCYSQGISLRACHSTARTPRENLDSITRRQLLLGNRSSRVSAINGSCSTLQSTEKWVLDSFDDEYGGVIVNAERLPFSTDVFASSLQVSLLHWKLKVKRGVWLKLPLERSELVPIAVKQGFKYHHAEPGYVMLTYWLPEEPCTLPANASHQVGVGGFVINDKDEVLVVQEKHCSPAFTGVWKIPTGFILESEDIYSGAVREVKEETGIETEFVEVIAFRHAHRMAFEKSDLFFICMLKPLSTEIVIDQLEIHAAQWMPLNEFVGQPFIQGDDMLMKIINICQARLGDCYCGLTPHKVISKFDKAMSCLYYNIIDG